MKKGSIVLASLILLLLAALYIVSLPMASFTKTGAVGPGLYQDYIFIWGLYALAALF